MKKAVAILLLLTITLTGIVVSLFVGYYATDTLQKNIQENLVSFHDNLKQLFHTFDAAVALEERKIKKEIEESLPKIAAEYLAMPEEKKNSREALLKLVKSYGFDELYIIDSAGKVIRTTFEPDLHFNLRSINEQYSKLLDRLLGSNEVYTERLTLSSKTGKLNIYGYYGPPGKDIIVEVSVSLREYVSRTKGEAYRKYLFEGNFLDAVRSQKNIVDIDLFMVNDLTAWSVIREGQKLDDSIRQVIAQKPEHQIVGNNRLTIYSQFDSHLKEGVFNQQFYTKAVFDIWGMRNVPYELLLAIVSALVLILPLSYLISIKMMGGLVFKPVDKLIVALEKIGKGDYQAEIEPSGLSEIQRISAVADGMREKILLREKELNKKNRILGMAAHNIRNPIANQLSCVDVLKGQLKTDRHEGVLKLLEHNAAAAIRILEDILCVSTLESGDIELDISDQSLAILVRERLMFFQRSAESKQIHLKYETPDDVTQTVAMDRDKIAQVIDNLISNALKYSHPQSTIELSIEDFTDEMCLLVRDEGIGIREEDIGVIFDPFCKTSNRPTGDESSTGLGLNISREITEAHGGRIEVKSEEGKGSEFYVYLPKKKKSRT